MNDLIHSSIDEKDSYVLTFMRETLPFSNWSAHQISIWGHTFQTVEHAYQYRKLKDVDKRLAKKIKKAKSAYEAKRLAKTRDIDRAVWDAQRVAIMTELLEAKINQHEDVREALLNTGSLAIIQKGNPEEHFWCIGRDAQGDNQLGKIWMLLRAKLENKNR